MSCNILTPKDPTERVIITFDFAPALNAGDVIASIEAPELFVIAGEEGAALPTLGTALQALGGTAVQLPIEGGEDATNYGVKCTVVTVQTLRLAVTANLPVRSQ